MDDAVDKMIEAKLAAAAKVSIVEGEAPPMHQQIALILRY
jgi:hypothetical protein